MRSKGLPIVLLALIGVSACGCSSSETTATTPEHRASVERLVKGADAPQIVVRADTNHDGYITADEFAANAAKYGHVGSLCDQPRSAIEATFKQDQGVKVLTTTKGSTLTVDDLVNALCD
jgi:ABC-type molybdate transport system substrate-binding protein